MLIPDVEGSSTTVQLTFYNSSGTLLGMAASLASVIAPGTGFSAGGGTGGSVGSGPCPVTVYPLSPGAPGTASQLTLTLNGG